MSTIKTAISLDSALFEAADDLAEWLHVSRSRLVTLALEAYLCRHQNRELLDRINASCDEADVDSDDERARLRGMRRHQRNVVSRDPS